MVAFNYRTLIRQVPPRTWQFYFQTRSIDLPPDHHWDMAPEQLSRAVASSLESLAPAAGEAIFSQLRRVHALANRRGVDALLNVASPDASLHDDFPQLTSDAERALWVMANWPDIIDAAEVVYAADLQAGKRGWKRLAVESSETLFRSPDDLRALESALAAAFTPRRGRPRACQIEALDRHLDGGLQLSIHIEDNAQRRLEFGDDDRVSWRDVRPPLAMDVIVYPGNGIIDIKVPGGAKAQQKVIEHVGRHVFRRSLEPRAVKKPTFFLNRLRNGFEHIDDSVIDLRAHGVECIRLSQARLRAALPPHCDYRITPPAQKDADDVLACLKSHRTDQALMSHGFNIVDAVITLYFEPTDTCKAGRRLHIELKQAGISNLSAMDEPDARLAEALLRALSVMQDSASALVAEAISGEIDS